LMAKSFLREKTEPTIFGIWPVGYLDMNPRGLDHLEWNTKKGSIFKTI